MVINISDAIWIAVASMTYNRVKGRKSFKEKDVLFSLNEICDLTSKMFDVECSADDVLSITAHEERATFNYLVHIKDKNFRLSYMSELGCRSECPDISTLKSVKELIEGQTKDKYMYLYQFINNDYSSIIKKHYENRNKEDYSIMATKTSVKKSEEKIKNSEEKLEKKLEPSKNMILYGPPGTGKTYNTVIYAVSICDDRPVDELMKEPYSEILQRFNDIKDKEKRIAFTTFHQSYGYEEFIEGIKPIMDKDSSEIEYTIKDGVFKKFCDRAGQKKLKTSNATVKENARVWNVILGGPNNVGLKAECFENHCIRIGWDKKPEIISYDTEGLNDSEKRILLNFQDEMEEGDIVVSRSTISAVNGIGIVKGKPEYDPTNKSYPRKREVEWIYTGEDVEIIELNGGVRLDRKTVYELKRINASNLLSKISYSTEVEIKDEKRPYVFIIDEINRGNISKIFGELITLIETSKRRGAAETMEALLPYSNVPFGVPDNVYILGTMNTADRSIALMDTALRRRFDFIEMMPDVDVLRTIGADKVVDSGIELDVAKMLTCINTRIEYLYDRDHTIGHAFFTGLKDEPTIEKLSSIFQKSVIPLLQEYFYEDYSKIMLVLGDNGKTDDANKFIVSTKIKANSVFKGNTSDIDLPECSYRINYDAFNNIKSYIEIMN